MIRITDSAPSGRIERRRREFLRRGSATLSSRAAPLGLAATR